MNKGRSKFRNLHIDWYYDESYGLTVKSLRCGVCKLPIQSTALDIDGTHFLRCSDNHLVGTDIDPADTQIVRDNAESTRVMSVAEFNNIVYDIVSAFKKSFDAQQTTDETI